MTSLLAGADADDVHDMLLSLRDDVYTRGSSVDLANDHLLAWMNQHVKTDADFHAFAGLVAIAISSELKARAGVSGIPSGVHLQFQHGPGSEIVDAAAAPWCVRVAGQTISAAMTRDFDMMSAQIKTAIRPDSSDAKVVAESDPRHQLLTQLMNTWIGLGPNLTGSRA